MITLRKKLSKIARWQNYLLVVGLSLILSACANALQTKPQLSARQQQLNQIAAVTNNLEHQGVQVARVGETVAIILASDQLFAPHSPNLYKAANRVLNNVAELMTLYETTFALVGGFTDNEGSHARNIALSRRQAEVVAEYLWSKQINARLLYTTGNDGDKPVASSLSRAGQAQNRRIEIYFRYLPINS